MDVDRAHRVAAGALCPAPGAKRAPSVDLQPTIYVSRDELPAVARALRDDPSSRFNVARRADRGRLLPREPRFEVVYLLRVDRAPRCGCG